MALSFADLANISQNRAAVPLQNQPQSNVPSQVPLNIAPAAGGSIRPGSLPSGLNLNSSGSLYNGPAQQPAPYTIQNPVLTPTTADRMFGTGVSKVASYVAPVVNKIQQITPQPIKDFGSGLVSNPGDVQKGKKVDFGSASPYDFGQFIGSGFGGDMPVGHLLGEAGSKILANLPQIATGAGLALAGIKDVSKVGKVLEEGTNLVKDVKGEGVVMKDIGELVSHEGAPDAKQVAKYVKDIENGQQIKPLKIIKEGDKYGVEDGKHRLAAYQQLGIKQVPTVIVNGPEEKNFAKGIVENKPNVPELITPSKTENLFQRLFSPVSTRIGNQGEAGKQVQNLLAKARDVGQTRAGTLTSLMPTVRKLSSQEFDAFVNLAEGKKLSSSIKIDLPKVEKALGEWQNVRQTIHAEALSSGLKVGKVENYFPHSYDQKIFEGKSYEKMAQSLINSGQAKDPLQAQDILNRMRNTVKTGRYGNLEAERIADLPGYEKTKESLFGYVERATERTAKANLFGPNNEKLTPIFQKLAQGNYDTKTVTDLFNIANNTKTYDGGSPAVLAFVRKFNTLANLGLSAISNATQSTNTASITGIMRTIMASAKTLVSPEARDFALKAGVTMEGVLQDLREGGGFAGKVLGHASAPLFNPVEKFNRVVAAWSGKGYAEDLAKSAASGSKGAIKGLEALGLDAKAIIERGGQLTEEETITAARKVVERTQFLVDPQDLPAWASSPWGKVVAQFRTFAYKQTGFLKKELLDPVLKQRNPAPLIRFLLAGTVLGEAAGDVRSPLTGKKRTDTNLPSRIGNDVRTAGGEGVLEGANYLKGFTPQQTALNTLKQVGGPTAGLIGDTAQALGSVADGKLQPLGKLIVNKIPVVGKILGPRLSSSTPKSTGRTRGRGSRRANL